MLQYIVDHQWDQFFRELIWAVVIGTSSNIHWEFVSIMISFTNKSAEALLEEYGL